MDNNYCRRCGNEFSKTYGKRCPFCQEDDAERRGRPIYRGGKRLSREQRSAGAGGVLKLVAAAVAVCVVLMVFFGDDLAQFMGIRPQNGDNDTPFQEAEQNGSHQDENTDRPIQDSSGNTSDPDQGSDIDQDGEQTGGEIVVQPLVLSQSAITIPAGETARITATGGSGEIVWTSSNEAIAIVSGGSVTGIAGGTVTITAVCGEESVSCTVTITGDPWVSPAVLSLNHTDFTLREGDPAVQMKVKGTDSPVVWRSSDPSVASIDESGVVRRVGRGTATITAEVDGQTLKCIVRVA